jgi:hypothetical protein
MVGRLIRYLTLALLAVTVFSARPASAITMLGDTVTINYLFPTQSSPYTGFYGLPATVTVANGNSDLVTAKSSRSRNATQYFSVNMQQSSIVVTFLQSLVFTPATFNGLSISGITQTITSATQVGQVPGVVSLVNNTVMFNFAGQTFRAGSTITANLLFSLAPLPAPIPLPAGLPLLGSGLGLLVWAGRRRRKAG